MRILLPAALALMGLLGTFVFGIYRLQRDFVEDEFAFRLEASEEFFQEELTDYSKKLGAAIDALSHDRQLRTMWRNGERQALLDYTSPLFGQLRSKYGITHFYFHNKDRTNFLRVHHPRRHGDLIERFTLRQAAETGRPQNGIELGPLGTFTLRSVYPCRIGGELVGYLELGQEIENITQRLHDVIGVDVIVFVEKEYLDRKSWETGMKMLGHNADWDRLDDMVVVDQTFGSLPDEILDSIEMVATSGSRQVAQVRMVSKRCL